MPLVCGHTHLRPRSRHGIACWPPLKWGLTSRGSFHSRQIRELRLFWNIQVRQPLHFLLREPAWAGPLPKDAVLQGHKTLLLATACLAVLGSLGGLPGCFMPGTAGGSGETAVDRPGSVTRDSHFPPGAQSSSRSREGRSLLGGRRRSESPEPGAAAAEAAGTELPSFPPAPQSLVPFPGGRLHFLPLNMRLSSHKFSLFTWACASGASVLCR